MNKKFNLFMLFVLVAQYVLPVSFAASEVTTYLSEENSIEEIASSDVTSEETASEEVTSEEAASEEVSSEETASEEVSSEETTSEEITSEEVSSSEITSEEVSNEENNNEITGSAGKNSRSFTWSPITDQYNLVPDIDEVYESYGDLLVAPENGEIIGDPYTDMGAYNSYGDFYKWQGMAPDNVIVRYHDVGTYAGKSFDMVFTVTDYAYSTSKGEDDAELMVGLTEPKLELAGYDNLEYKVSFYEAGTDNPMTISGILNVDDIDAGQLASISTTDVPQENIFVNDPTVVQTDIRPDYYYFSATGSADGANTPEAKIMAKYWNASELNLSFGSGGVGEGYDPDEGIMTGNKQYSYTGFQFRLLPPPVTVVEKELLSETDADGTADGVASVGDEFTYRITITNESTDGSAINVPVRDSLLENLPAEFGFDGVLTIDPTTIEYTGSLTDGDFMITEVPTDSSVTIDYTIAVNGIPDDIGELANIVTDTGLDPLDPDLVCTDVPEDCVSVVNPLDPETTIEKSVTDADGNGALSAGENFTYTITVTNPNTVVDATDVVVRDSLLENLADYPYLTFVSETLPTGATGSLLTDGVTIPTVGAGSSVTISAELTLTEIPTDAATILNIVTDNGVDPLDPSVVDPTNPEVCLNEEDCSTAEIGFDAETTVEKSLLSEDGTITGIAEDGETLTYQLAVTNPETNPAVDVVVRDSIVESLPAYITYNSDLAITIGGTDLILDTDYTGDLSTADLTINEIAAGETAYITYSVTIGELPDAIESVTNIVTDNGVDPLDPSVVDPTNPEVCLNEEDCSIVVTPTNPNTELSKTVDAGSDNVVSEGETITYTITVANTSDLPATAIPVKDSLLAALPTYVTFNDDITISMDDVELILDTDYTGDLTTTDGIIINSIPAGSVVTITYSLTLDSIPADGVVELANVVTDNGDDPSVIDPETCPDSEDCAEITIPVDAETTITKALTNESIENDTMAQDGEELTYTLTVTNPSDAVAFDVEVRDSLLENMPAWITLVGDITIDPTTIETTGSLTTGDFVITEIPADSSVTITYTVLASDIPSDATEVANIATDNGIDPTDPSIVDPENPDVCLNTDDCGLVVVPTNPETSISKSLTAESIETNAIAEIGETLTYQITVTNDDATLTAKDIAVRDSVVEAIANGDITYLTFDGFTVAPDTITYSGTLDGGDLSIDEIPAGETVTIEYTLTVLEIPAGVVSIDNIATDNGLDPTDPDSCVNEEDCSEVVTPTNPDTVIEKSVVDANGDTYAQEDEVLTFTIKVSNSSAQDTASIPVKDSLVEAITDGSVTGLTYNDDATVTGVTYDATATGSLTDGSYLINSIPAGQYAEITYTVTVDEIGTDVASIINIATDDGTDPSTLTPEDCALDTTNCATTETPVDPETLITKTVADTDDDIVQTGEELTYTITVTNPNTEVAAQQVVVRDSILENLPSYITVVSEEIAPTSVTATGSLTADGITIAEIPADSEVVITVVVTVDEIPNDVESILNVATDNGIDPTDPSIVDPTNPEVCLDEEDCSIAVIPVEPETSLKKTLANESGTEAGVIENGETVTYQIDVTNPGANSAYDVVVRDSMLEALPSYATYNDDLKLVVDGTELVAGTDYSGDLSSKDLSINEISAGTTVTITYSITFDVIPNDVAEVGNLAVDTDVDPTDPDVVDPELCDESGSLTDECSSVVLPVHPETIITKTAVDGNDDGYIQEGEEIQYTITVENPSVVDAKDVQVIDSLLSNIPDYMSLTTDVVVTDGTNTLELDTDYTGDLTTTDGIVINTITAGSTITITYGLTLDDVPASGVIEVANVATDNGQDPTDPDTGNPIICTEDSEDCSSTVLPVDPDTTITKAKTSESITDDNQAQQGEEITYTITVTNPTDADAINVEVKDSILANMPDYLSLVGAITIDPTTTETTGDLTTDDFVITNLPANSSVTITYTLLVGDVPSDLTELTNIATDNGIDPLDPSIVDPENPGVCINTDECGIVVVPTNPETEIEKALTNESVDVNGIAEPGETLTYEIRVTNNDDALNALDIPVRDSLIEEITNGDYPDYTYNGITGTTPDPLATNGDLTTGDFTIDSIAPGSTVVIEYTVTLADPATQTDKVIGNIVTDNGDDPVGICPPTSDDCDQVIITKEPDTIITKSVTDTDGNGLANQDEILTYTITLENPTLIGAENVHVRDSLLEDMPSYLELVEGSMTVDPDTVGITGDAESGFIVDHVDAGQTITFTYQVKVLDVPDTEETVTNIVTDDAQDPTTCTEISSDCSGTVTPLEPETVVEKTVTDANGDGAVQTGEELTYEITVSNTHDTLSALEVEVRDSMLENLPAYITVVSEEVAPTTVTSTGSLTTGGITIDEIPADTDVVITVVVTVDEIPTDLVEVLNIVTDNGVDPLDPSIVDPENPGVCLNTEDCGIAVLPADPETVVTKSIIDESIEKDNMIQSGETVTYQVDVTNPGANTALDVIVRDSLVEQIANGDIDWLTFNDDIVTNPADLATTGKLQNGNYTIDQIEVGQTITITYSITAGIIPEGNESVVNIVTDNGIDPLDPTIVDPENPDVCLNTDDCSIVVVPTNPDTLIEKTVTGANEDLAAQTGETLTYTITVTNPEEITAKDVVVRDSLIENLPAYLELASIKYAPETTSTTGSLQAGDFTISEIPAGETYTITYVINVIEVPTDVADITNIATDNGIDPTDPSIVDPENPGVCINPDNCGSTVTPVDPETIVEKELAISGDDEFISTGEDLTYTITVTNPNTAGATALDVLVRDSMLEALATDYPYLTLVSEDVTPITLDTTGSLTESGVTIAELGSEQTATITVVLHVEEIPNDVSEILNIVTDNGTDPDTIDPETCTDTEDCAEVTNPVDADTTIEKMITNESIASDGLAAKDEVITYMLKVTNENTEATAYDVAVRDSMYENLPSELEIVNPYMVNPTSVGYTGDLAAGTLVLGELAPGQTATIVYGVKVNVINQETEFLNIATDNGVDPTDPSIVDPENPGVCLDEDDCSGVTLPIKPDTTIKKQIIDESTYTDNLIEDGETVTYRLTIENISSVDSLNTPIQDSVLQDLDSYDWLTLGNVTVGPEGTVYSGDLTDGSFVVDVPALSTVTIEYELIASEVPSDEKVFENVATDDGTDPALCTPALSAISSDCSIHLSLLEADTQVTKVAQDANLNGVIEDGESVRYIVDVHNYTNIAAADTQVRDSLLENLPDYATVDRFAAYDSNRNGLDEGVDYEGSLEDGDLVIYHIPRRDTVRLEYYITFDVIPDEVTEISNLVTTDGSDPETCPEDSINCTEVITPVEGDTTIDKTIASEDGQVDGVIEQGETVTYQLTIENPSENKAVFINVRDTMLENMPEYATLSSDIVIEPAVAATGDLQSGDYTITAMEPGDVVTITYDITFDGIPDSEVEIVNIATDNGTEVDPETCPLPMKASRSIISDDCAYVTEPAEGDTTITKALIDETLAIDGLAELGEQLTYELTITNEMDKDAYLVPVRDSLIENLPSWLSIDSITIGSDDYTGKLEDGTLVLDQVAANSSVVITYVLVVEEVAQDQTEIANIATDDGQDPSVINPETCTDDANDCSSVVIPLDGDTTIAKTVVSTNDVYVAGDTIDYQVAVTNYTSSDAYEVMVRDSLLENAPEYVQYNKDIEVKGATASGDIESGTYTLDVVPENSTAYITYSLDLVSTPTDESLSNIVTDDGSSPVEKEHNDNEDYIDVTLDPTIPMTDGGIIETGAKTMIILINLGLILIASLVLKRRIS